MEPDTEDSIAITPVICRCLGIKKTRTTAYHPQSDGLVERFNRTLQNMLATTTESHPATWENHVQKVVMAYNTSVQSSTGYQTMAALSVSHIHTVTIREMISHNFV